MPTQMWPATGATTGTTTGTTTWTGWGTQVVNATGYGWSTWGSTNYLAAAPQSMPIQVTYWPYQQTYQVAADPGIVYDRIAQLSKEEQQRADEAAEELLHQLIGDARYRVWKEHGHVWVISTRHRGVAYQVRARRRIQLWQREEKGWRKEQRSLCIHPPDQYPKADEVATLVVLAEAAEERLWRTANVHARAA